MTQAVGPCGCSQHLGHLADIAEAAVRCCHSEPQSLVGRHICHSQTLRKVSLGKEQWNLFVTGNLLALPQTGILPVHMALESSALISGLKMAKNDFDHHFLVLDQPCCHFQQSFLPF